MSSLYFVLAAPAAQRIHDSLVCLSKFSEYICLEARPNRLTLSALNTTKSSYGAVALSSTRFFEEYRFVEGHGNGVDPQGSRFTCRLYAKVAHTSISVAAEEGIEVMARPTADTSSPRLC